MVKACKNKIAIIGGGASGCICTYFLLQLGLDVVIFEKGKLLHTLLPTGGGRCNLAHAEFDFKELAKHYPRGEKFLYSIFAQFSTAETLEMFDKIGIKTYIQNDNRIFPISNSSKDVQNKIINQITSAKIINEKVTKIIPKTKGFEIITDTKKYFFYKVIISIGGHSGSEILKDLEIKFIPQKPALVGLNIVNPPQNLSGVIIKNCVCENLHGDILFTHFGISGPLIYKISSINAYKTYPYKLKIDLCPNLENLQDILNNNPHKEIKNVLTEFIPQKIAYEILKKLKIEKSLKSHSINGKMRDMILENIHSCEVLVTGTNKGEETVTAGGIDLKEINPKNMEFKKYNNLYALGEILDIDGDCGGFNLQNAWSTAFVCANAILNEKENQ